MINPALAIGAPARSGGQNSRLSIFYLNDLHGQTDNLHSMLIASRNFDDKNTGADKLKLSGGDNFAGGDVKKNLMVASFLNVMNIDATAVGNHEFDAGTGFLDDFIRNSKAEFLSSNVKFENQSPLHNAVKESVIKEVNGTKYGIIGLSTPDLGTTITKKEGLNGITVKNNEQSTQEVQKQINELRAQGVNRIILLSHSGYIFDKELAQKTHGIDVIISAHSHDAIKGVTEGENLVKGTNGESVLIVQAGENGHFYGVCDIEFNDNGFITRVGNQITKTQSYKSPLIEHVKNATLGTSPKVADIKEIDPIPPNRRIAPCAWTNLLADSMRVQLGTDIAFINSANTRKVPQAGDLTQRDIFDTTPMKNKLVTTTINEKQIVEAIKAAAQKTMSRDDGEPGLLQVAGLDYAIDTKGNLIYLNFIDTNGTKTKINTDAPSDKTYTVALDNFVADGREYPELKLPNLKLHEFDKDKTAGDYITKITQEGKLPLSIKDDGRLKIIQTSMPRQSNNNTQNFLGLTLPKNV